MTAEGNNLISDRQEAVAAERDKQKLTGRKVADVVKGVAVTYVGFQLGLLALRFIGRKLRGKPAPEPNRARSVRALSFSPASAQEHAPFTSEDSWAVVDASPPDTPDGYKPIVNAVVPCSPQELYAILISGAGTDLYLKQHREVGKQWDLVATGWRKAGGAAPAAAPAAADGSLLGDRTVFEYVVGQPGPGGFTRLLTFWNPKKPPSTVDTRCVQRQQFCVYRGGVLVFATAMNMLDIPFKDCFTVNTMWRVAPGQAPGTSAVTINLKVQFIKRAMGVGGIISATTFRDSAAFFTAFVANVTGHVMALRERAAAPLPAPLPVSALAPAPTARGARAASSGVSRTHLVSPFAAAAGAAGPAPAPASGGAAVPPARQALPAWKQLRALVVIAVLAFTLLHQLHLRSEIAAMRGQGRAAGGAAVGGEATGSGLAAQAGGLLAAALGPVATAAGSLHLVLQALVDRVGGRAPPVLQG